MGAAKKLQKSRDAVTRAAGALWALSSLFFALAVIALVPGTMASISALLVAAAVLLAVAGVMLLAMSVITLRRDAAYDGDADFADLHPLLRWPVTIGSWVGAAITAVAGLALLFNSSAATGLPDASTRFAMSIVAIVGAGATLFASPVLPESALIALLCVWAAIVVLALVRGTYGLVRGLFR